MAQSSRTADLTSGPMLQKIILFSIPLAASSILQLLFNAADVVVVGRFAGSTALAAVGLCALWERLFCSRRGLQRIVRSCDAFGIWKGEIIGNGEFYRVQVARRAVQPPI